MSYFGGVVMLQLIWWMLPAVAAVGIAGAGYRVGRWHQRAIHAKELVRRRLLTSGR